MKKLNKKGFTIVELVIVIAIIAILAAVMIPTFSGTIEKAKMSAAFQEVKNAVTDRLAEDLSTSDTSDDMVYGKTIEVHHEGFVFVVTNGTVANESTEADAEKPDYEITSAGKLQAKS